MIQKNSPDFNFIKNSWLKSYKVSYEGRYQKMGHYSPVYSAIIDGILNRSETKALLEKEKNDFIKGFLIFEGDLLHYLYVRRSFRKKGIGRGLLREFFEINKNKRIFPTTFITGDFVGLLKKMDFEVRDKFFYEPNVLRFKENKK